jgi:hypothetical protein
MLHHPHGPADRSDACPLRHQLPAGLLQHPYPNQGHQAELPDHEHPGNRRWCQRDCAAQPRHPRIANALLRRIRDFPQIKGDGIIDKKIVDEGGLDEMDNKVLDTVINKFKGGPVGLTIIATVVGEDAGTVEEVHEPFLIMEG